MTPPDAEQTPPGPRDDDDERPVEPPHTPPSAAQVAELRASLEELRNLIASQHAADVHGLSRMLGSKKRLMGVNLLTGLARGVGFFLGATLIGALLIGGTAYFFDASAEALGLKDYTTQRFVRALYGKFREIKQVIDEIETEEPAPDGDASESTGDDKAGLDLGK